MMLSSDIKVGKKGAPELKIREFQGPLDLLFHLIEKNDIDIYDIPITEITDQYMAYLSEMSRLDMEVASDFLVMAATLIHIKSRMLLPGKIAQSNADEGNDPREELVIRLLHYRRCKVMASDLRKRFENFSDTYIRLPSTPRMLDIKVEAPPQEFDPNQFSEAVRQVALRNEVRFADLASKITHILKRDKISVREKMKTIWASIMSRGKCFFHELFPSSEVDKSERVVGFLAVLELLRGNKISATQDKPFDVILIERKSSTPEDSVLDSH